MKAFLCSFVCVVLGLVSGASAEPVDLRVLYYDAEGFNEIAPPLDLQEWTPTGWNLSGGAAELQGLDTHGLGYDFYYGRDPLTGDVYGSAFGNTDDGYGVGALMTFGGQFTGTFYAGGVGADFLVEGGAVPMVPEPAAAMSLCCFALAASCRRSRPRWPH
jgi:hypothetical protein